MKEFKSAILAFILSISLAIVLAISAVVIDTVEMYAVIGFVFVFAILLLAMVAALGVIEAVIIWGFLKIKEAINKKTTKCNYRGEVLSFNRLRWNLMKEGYSYTTATNVAKLYIVK